MPVDLEKLMGNFQRSVSTEESEAQKKGGYLTGRQIAWLIHKTCKIRCESAAILDLGELLRVELKNDNVQAFDAKWMNSYHP